ncbi:MAG: tetratricopeptide repeat protein [Bryobacterales bacterium]|nr:tetratricopeptide repeat protein [Bryobacterales bacterium]
MSYRVAALLLVGVLGAGCSVRRTYIGAKPHAVEAPTVRQPAVKRAMAQHVRNAVLVGEGDPAIRQLRQRIAGDPNNVDLRLELAKRYAEQGIKDLALEHYRVAAERFPDNPWVHLPLAKALREAELRIDAVGVLDNYLKKHPESPAVLWSWAGIIHDELNELETGERAHRNALLRRRPTAWLLNNLGQNLLLQGKREEAMREFESALALEPRNELVRNNLGIALAANPKEAVSHLQSVTDPSTAHSNLAAVLIEQGKYADARQELQLALGYRRDNTAALANLALLGELDGKGSSIKLKSKGRAARSRESRPLHTQTRGKKEGEDQ